MCSNGGQLRIFSLTVAVSPSRKVCDDEWLVRCLALFLCSSSTRTLPGAVENLCSPGLLKPSGPCFVGPERGTSLEDKMLSPRAASQPHLRLQILTGRSFVASDELLLLSRLFINIFLNSRPYVV